MAGLTSGFNSRLSTSVRVIFTWKAIATEDVDVDRLERNRLFRVVPNPGFFSGIGVTDPPLVPKRLLPTIVYYQAVRTSLRRKFGIDTGVGRLPVLVPLPGVGECRVNATVRIFDDSLVAVTLTAVVEDDAVPDPHSLIQVQLLKNVPELDDVVSTTLRTVVTGSHRNTDLNVRFDYKPGVYLAGDHGATSQDAAFRRSMAGVLIRSDPAHLEDHVIEHVWTRNERHWKTQGTKILLDKQGLVFVAADERRQARHEFNQSLNVLELALASRATLSQASGDSRLASAAAGWISDSSSAIPESYSRRLLWESLVDELALVQPVERRRKFAQREQEKKRVRADRLWGALGGAAAISLAALIAWLVTRLV